MNDAMVNTIVPESGFRTPAEMGDAKAPTGHLLTTSSSRNTRRWLLNLLEGPKEHFSPVSDSR